MKLKFSKCEDGHYIISGPAKNSALGCVDLHGEVFPKRVVFTSFDIIEWTAECLQQVVDFINSLESKVIPTNGGKRK
jgi:hypothetical protein